MSARTLRGRAIARLRGHAMGLALLTAWLLAAPADAGLNLWSSSGPPSVSILSLAVDPLAPGTVYAGSNGQGVFRTRNGGGSWAPVNAGLANLVVRALAVHPFGTGIVYAGTSGGGVFRSLDNGESWAPTGLTSGVTTALAIDPLVPTTLYAGTTGQGAFKSVNGGQSWAPINVGLTNPLVTALAVDPVSSSVVYAGANGAGGVFRSVNAGGSWTAVNAGLVNTVVSSLAIDPVNPSTLYAGTSGGGVFRSTNSGTTWTAVNSGLTDNVITALALNPRAPAVLYASARGTGVFRTSSAGASWSLFNAGLTDTLVNALAITPAGVCAHAGTQGTAGVFDFAFEPSGCAPVAVVAAVLPSSRSVLVNGPATAFATILNPAPAPVLGCGIAMLGAVPAGFSFQTTNPATNEVTGSPNVAVDIAAQGLQTYVISLTPAVPIGAADVRFNFVCTTSASAPIIIGVNTLLLSASATPVPDVVALAASDGGIVNVSGNTGTGVFAVATINLGAGAAITASADTGGAFLPVSLTVCETNAGGTCLAPPGPPVTRVINPGETPTFGIFVAASAFIPFDPATTRIFVRFTDPGGQLRGSTSVAVRTQ